MKVYIVEESTWDHHSNIKVFLTEAEAFDFCNLNYEFGDMREYNHWVHQGFNYFVEEYTVENTGEVSL